MIEPSDCSVSRADLHVHSKYSDRPSEWILRRIGAPECFTEPLEVYRKCRARGMRFVTISDHNRIEGALEIAHLPSTFISNEVTTYFPEDGCKIHCLVFGIDEEQHREIEVARRSIYELRDYLYAEDIAYSVAHPLFSVNNRLTVEHFEKLLLLFKRFEGVNGARDPRASEIFLAIARGLDEPMIDELRARHPRIEPRDRRPWEKWFTAGSDDHGGLYIAGAYTETPAAATVEEFLDHLRAGRHELGGESGSSLRLAHSFYSIAWAYYRARLLRGVGRRGKDDLVAELFARFVGSANGSDPTLPGEKLMSAARLFLGQRKKPMGDVDRRVVASFSRLAVLGERRTESPSRSIDRQTFDEACRVSQDLTYAFLRKFAKHLRRGRLTESLQTISAVAPLAVCVAPYLAAFHTQHKDQGMLRAIAGHFPAASGRRRKSVRRAWFADGLRGHDSLSTTLTSIAALARERDEPFTLVTSLGGRTGDAELAEAACLGLEVQNFKPVGAARLPGGRRLVLPPFLEIIEWCERAGIHELVLASPGPLGLIGLAAARLLGLRVTALYDTELPQDVRAATESEVLEAAAWTYLRWVFDHVDTVYAASSRDARMLAERGVTAGRVKVLPPAVDTTRFDPRHRDPTFWHRFGLDDRFKFLYVGRVVVEKNLDALFASFFTLIEGDHRASLVIVGDGPYLGELRRRYRRHEILFTGRLEGPDLARAYAGSEVFVLPGTVDRVSTTLLEAHASGLPAILFETSGAAELVSTTGSGRVVASRPAGGLADAMLELYLDATLRAGMSERGLALARNSGWERLFAELWPERAAAEASEFGALWMRTQPVADASSLHGH